MKNNLSIIISILAVAISGFTAYSFDIDTQNASFVLGVLTALVTILITWNIFSLIDFNKKKEELDGQNAIIANAIIEMNNRQFKIEGATEQTIADVYYHLMGLKHPYPKEYFYINHILCAITKFSQTEDYYICNELSNALLHVIDKPETIYIPQKRKNELLTFLHNIKGHEKITRYSELTSLIVHLSDSGTM